MFTKKVASVYSAIDVAYHVINYSYNTSYGVSNLKLQKLLYFVQVYFLITEDRCCFRDDIEAWDFGPVVPTVYRAFCKYGGCTIPPVKNIPYPHPGFFDVKYVPYHDDAIREEDKDIIHSVVDKFRDYTATSLVALTQSQEPWIKAWNSKSRIIQLNDLLKYFNQEREECR